MPISKDGQYVRQETIITKEQKKKLKALSEKTGIAITDHIRRAIDLYLNKRPED